ncbi:hypothetical protein [Malaciobacter marinus]|uniref:hypothetical protein n=1 Tax=Malaciobacter marinus TaxID=505249 RepID=UPI003B00F24F
MEETINFIICNADELSKIAITLFGSITAIIAVLTYKSKAKVEKSLIEKNEAEIDIKLIKQFSELINIANGRSGYLLSENAISEYFKLKDIKNYSQDINKELESLAILTLPVGKATQNATAIALTDFALKNPLLLKATINGINELPIDENIKTKCLGRLNT